MLNMRMLRIVLRVSVLSSALLAVAVPAAAQIVHSVSFGVGMFTPRSVDNRASGDVLYADLHQPAIDPADPNTTSSLLFDIKDFRSVPVFGEWHIGFGNHFEVGVSAAYANQTVKSIYRDVANSNGTPADFSDDTNIAQDLRLQTIPISGVVRILGGRPGHFQPYGGGGVVAVIFKYTETGDFVDYSVDPWLIYNAKYEANGTAYGPVILGGARVPLGGDVYALNFEGRYQWVVGKTGGFDAGFLGDKLDLGGWYLNAGFMIRF